MTRKCLYCLGSAALASVLVTGCATGIPGSGSGPVASRTITERSAVADERMVTRTQELYGEDADDIDPDEIAGQVRSIDDEAVPVPDDFDPFEMEYLIEPGDVLQFMSLDDSSLNQSVQVRYDGHVSLPFVPDIPVGQKTREEAIHQLTEAYSELFREPQVSLTISQPNSKRFYVMGEVSSPGNFSYDRPLTLLDAINLAGGPRLTGRRDRDLETHVGEHGQLTRAFIIRTLEGYRDVLEFDLRYLTEPGSHPSQTLIYPGDIVYIPEGVNLVYLFGEVSSPGVYRISEGMSLLQLIARAGGHRPSTARSRSLVLMREIDEEHTEILLINFSHILRTGDDILLEPGDIIYIPRSRIVQINEFINQYTSPLNRLMSLYRTSLSTWYARDRYRRVSRDATTTQDIVTFLENIQRIGGAVPDLDLIVPE